MEYELHEYNENRHREFAILLEKQRGDLANIDAEISSLGINIADLTETIPDIALYTANTVYQLAPHDRQLLTPNSNFRVSLMSLPRSHSSTSFASNGRGSINSMPKS